MIFGEDRLLSQVTTGPSNVTLMCKRRKPSTCFAVQFFLELMDFLPHSLLLFYRNRLQILNRLSSIDLLFSHFWRTHKGPLWDIISTKETPKVICHQKHGPGDSLNCLGSIMNIKSSFYPFRVREWDDLARWTVIIIWGVSGFREKDQVD